MTTATIIDRVASDIVVVDTGRFRVGDREEAFAPHITGQAGQMEAWVVAAGRMIGSLIYEEYYLGRRRNVEGDNGDKHRPVVYLEDKIFGQALRAANAGGGWEDPGWICLGGDGENWHVTKNGVRLNVARAELSGKIVEGKPVAVLFPNALPYVSRGFYMAVGDAGPVRAHECIQRIYVNLASDTAADALAILTRFLKCHRIRGQVKVLNHPDRFDRPDGCTLYLERVNLAELHVPLGRALSLLDRRSDTPGFCYRWMPGIGFAEEPSSEGRPTSFGEHRSRLIGMGIARAYLSGRASRQEIRQELGSAGIKPELLYLNPGSEGVPFGVVES